MILFHEDWLRYPDAIVDTETKNRSFVRLASVYRSMGIKNHTFLLALLNPRLQGVDPHSPDLTLEQKAWVSLECKHNPFYFLREVARVPSQTSGPAGMVEANRGNICLFWCFFNHVLIILIQIRQTGKSLNTDLLMTLLLNIMCENTQINLMTLNDTLRRKNIERIKEIVAELPGYLQQKSPNDVNNGEEITVMRLNNNYVTHVPQMSPKHALTKARGLTSPIFHCDEAPFQPNIGISLPAALAAGGAANEAAEEAGTPYGTILTTTAGKKDDKDGMFVYKLLSDCALWTEGFFDAQNVEMLHKMVKGSSRNGQVRVNATFNHQQLGKTDEWLKKRLDDSLQSGEDANRDFFNVWTSGNASNPIHVDLLERIANSARADFYTAISNPDGYITRWYIPQNEIARRMASSKFILGMDTSDAGGGDDLSLVITDVETLEVVAAGTYNETNLITFASWVCQVLVDFPNITGIIERKSSGAMLLDYLLLMLPQFGIDPFRRLFNTVVNSHDEDKERYKEICIPMNRRSKDVYIRYKTTFGFATAATGYASRTGLYSTTLQNAAKLAADKIYDQPLIKQINGLVVRNGRIDHEKDGHDDLVIGWLLANWLMTQGKNLIHYGIDVKQVMIDVDEGKPEELGDPNFRREQQEVREEIEAIYNQLTGERDDYVVQRLEHRLRALDKKVVLETGEVYSLDGLLNSVAEKRRAARRTHNTQPSLGYGVQPVYQHGVYSNRPLSANELI